MQIALEASMIQLKPQAAAISELDDIDTLVAVYWARVLRYVSFSIGDADLAQTITQNTFLRAYNARASFRGDCAVKSWLIGIANNLIRDQLRPKNFSSRARHNRPLWTIADDESPEDFSASICAAIA